jgi:hypothetical protein
MRKKTSIKHAEQAVRIRQQNRSITIMSTRLVCRLDMSGSEQIPAAVSLSTECLILDLRYQRERERER